MKERIVGYKIKKAREKAGLSVQELARRMGRDPRHLAELETEGVFLLDNKEMWLIVQSLDCHIEDILDMTSSHSERDIIDGCIRLMHTLTGEFEEWLINTDLAEEISDEETFCVNIPYMEIVRELFLSNTKHSGGTSCCMKLQELGVDKYAEQFDCYPEKEELS